jgi:hypothetical protein
MKLSTVVALTVLLLAAPGSARPDSCSCAGDAGTNSICIDGDSEDGMALALKMSVTLEFRHGSNKQLSDELTRITGKRIAVSPSKPDEAINLDVKDAPLWDVLETLAQSRTVLIGGEDFLKLQVLRQSLLTDDKVSVCIHNVPLERVVNELSGLSGKLLHITSGNTKAPVTLSSKRITLEKILSRLSAQTGAQIEAR